MGTARDFGNMLNQKFVTTKKIPRKEKPKASPWLKMGKKTKGY